MGAVGKIGIIPSKLIGIVWIDKNKKPAMELNQSRPGYYFLKSTQNTAAIMAPNITPSPNAFMPVAFQFRALCRAKFWSMAASVE